MQLNYQDLDFTKRVEIINIQLSLRWDVVVGISTS